MKSILGSQIGGAIMNHRQPLDKDHEELAVIIESLHIRLQTCEVTVKDMNATLLMFYRDMCGHIAGHIKTGETLGLVLGHDSSQIVEPMKRSLRCFEELAEIIEGLDLLAGSIDPSEPQGQHEKGLE